MIIHSPSQIINRPTKIISLVPSQTELLCDLGLEKEVIGITKFCIHPPEWRKTKTIIGGTKNVNIEKIKQLKPDLIIANKEENLKEQVELLAEHFDVWVTDINNLQDAIQMIKDVGVVTQTNFKSTEMVDQIQYSFNHLQTCSEKIRTCYLIWQQPYMTIGGDTFINDMLQHCGFANLFADEKRYPALDIAALKGMQCELLLLSSEPFPFKEKHAAALQALLPQTKVMLVDGEMFSWYGSRLVKAPSYFNSIISQLY